MTYLANQIKQHRLKLALSQKALANRLGVSQTSIAHYELGNRQPTIENLIAMSSLFEVSVDDLVGAPAHKDVNSEGSKAADQPVFVPHPDQIDTLLKLLLNHQCGEFSSTMVRLAETLGLQQLVEYLVVSIQECVGTLWEQGKITEADEHFATYTIRKTMQMLYGSAEGRPATKRAVAMSVHAEQHTLGLELIAEFLDKNGVKTLYIGRSVPVTSLNRILDTYNPEYLLLSITLKDHMNSLITLIDSITTKNRGLEILIGGQASSGLDLSLIDTQRHRVRVVGSLNQLIEMVGDSHERKQ